jgi:hypothetical protein
MDSLWTLHGLHADSTRTPCGVHKDRWGTVKYRTNGEWGSERSCLLSMMILWPSKIGLLCEKAGKIHTHHCTRQLNPKQ